MMLYNSLNYSPTHTTVNHIVGWLKIHEHNYLSDLMFHLITIEKVPHDIIKYAMGIYMEAKYI